MSDQALLVVGLGNPGPKYAANRHNVGFMIADLLADRLGGTFGLHKRARAQVCEARLGIGGPRLVLVKPLTFMNLSGQSVAPLAQFYKIEPEQVVVAHDELDLPFGTLRLKQNGGEGGHNGLRSLSKSLNTKEYVRLRFGIGRPSGRQDAADYVLRDFSSAERKEVPVLLELAADAVEAVAKEGLASAQNRIHAQPT
ncbi:aminoacyl-tRNA hydrolase [Natronoglycomyces albus]|uniref:Peptidyl-tRNA hydrolase n=1 Tax=Natronoglycomyces albus TaxID=2811108 RepID=A0A895XSE3_9ACTN|nr:aminoacyl-tRNA hydrolase [Natronoglycomyces albus]QSB06145.1 aminoacyl-tRNA hydrolase [Natronoglycomyces albus]